MKNHTTKFSASVIFTLTCLAIFNLTAFVRAQMPGDLDLSFNGTGTKMDGLGNGFDQVNDIAVQADGKIVAVGQTTNGVINNFAAVRYNLDGSLDTSFGESGKVQFLFGNASSTSLSVALQSDDKIVIAGRVESSFALARLNSDGSFDDSFGSQGKVLTSFVYSPSITSTQNQSVAIQSDGKIIVGGYFFASNFSGHVIARYNTDGSLDTTFNTDGKLVIAYSSNTSFTAGFRSIAIQSDGKIVTAGFFGGSIHIVRYNSNGSVDNTFGSNSNGQVAIGLGNSSAFAVSIQTDGKIVVAGTGRQTTLNNDFVAVRLNSNGTFDTSFDTDGIAVTPVGSNSSIAFSLAIQSDNKIVLAGQSSNGANQDFTTVRYNTNGSLDTSFNGNGKLITPIGTSNDNANAVAIQMDGKIIVGGQATMPNTGRDFALTRYNENGTLDLSYDSDGIRTDNLGNNNIAAGYGTVIQPDGKIVVAGSATETNNDFAVFRYNSDGTPDATFNGAGKIRTEIGTSTDFAFAVAIQPDGKIIAAGFASITGNSDDIALVRYNTDGSLDTTFSSDGIVTTHITSVDRAYSVIVQPDGKIVIGGITSSTGINYDFAVVRYNSNGSLDTTFNGTGIVTTAFGGTTINDQIWGMRLQLDGKIVVAGQTRLNGTDDFALARYNINGSLDTTFGTGGTVITPIGSSNDIAKALEIQSDGKIVAAGFTVNSNNDFAVVRYNPNGSLDTTFNGNGIVTTPIGTGNDAATSMGIQSDGKILLAGQSAVGADVEYAVVRYNTDGILDDNFAPNSKNNLYGNGGKVIIDFPGSGGTANGLAIDSNNRAVIVGSAGGLMGIARLHGNLVPTSANAEISGRVVNDFGNGLNRVRVSLQNAQTGEVQTVSTNAFGYFKFEDLPVGNTYILTVADSKRYFFKQNTQIIQLFEKVSDVIFTGSTL